MRSEQNTNDKQLLVGKDGPRLSREAGSLHHTATRMRTAAASLGAGGSRTAGVGRRTSTSARLAPAGKELAGMQPRGNTSYIELCQLFIPPNLPQKNKLLLNKRKRNWIFFLLNLNKTTTF